ncbi:MAG: hypothetical protein B7Z15_18690 [Rhizobiales bacterium 32-66-8]|nr:MAG: hypothetical protein B7Z15_18690 [Rhizobiales bacterium 32-66-8]
MLKTVLVSLACLRASLRRALLMAGLASGMCGLAPSFVSPAVAASGAPTLCRPGETVVFSCPTGGRTASVCASADLSSATGTMTYRYGRPDAVELSFPAAGVRPADAFTSGTLMFAGGGGAWLRFENGGVRYTVFSAIGKWGRGGAPLGVAGVAVQKGGTEIANVRCRADPTGELGPDFFARAGLKTAAPDAEFEIPESFFPK